MPKAYNYTYEPPKLNASKAQISKDAFKQTYMINIDGIEYAGTCLIRSGEIFFANRTDIRNPEFDINLHKSEDHVYKMFYTLNLIINRYVKSPDVYKTMGRFIVKSIELSPALNIAGFAIEIGERNRLYEDMMNSEIFNTAVKYDVSYNGNNIIFSNLIMRPSETEKMHITEL